MAPLPQTYVDYLSVRGTATEKPHGSKKVSCQIIVATNVFIFLWRLYLFILTSWTFSPSQILRATQNFRRGNIITL